MNISPRPLLGLSPQELKALAAEGGMPPFAARQIAEWLYGKHITSISDMTNLSKQAREWLTEHCTIGCQDPIERRLSADGTVKYLFPAAGGRCVESVFIPSKERATLCVSSQVGCKMGCAFCMTGRQGFEAQLSVADILNQIHSLPERDRLTNIVFMGQGEPLDNLDNVLHATETLTAPWGFGWSPKRITVSTIGLGKGLKRLLEESKCNIAVSLHNPFPSERALLMPAEQAFSIEKTVKLLREYEFCRKMRNGEKREESHQRRLSFEYIVFEGINDTNRHMEGIISLLSGLDCRVNLIRFHSIPDTPLQGVSEERMLTLRDYLTNRGFYATVRASRGEDILAACGLLSTARKERGKTPSENRH